MFSPISNKSSCTVRDENRQGVPAHPPADKTPSPADRHCAVPFVLSRIYEGQRPFLSEDQDCLSRIFKPLIRIAIDHPAKIRLSEWQKIGEVKTRTGVGIFLNPATGEKFSVKKTSDAGKAANEVLCASLAGRFGLNVPKVQALEEDGQHYIASAFIEGLQLANERFPNCAFDPKELVKIARQCPDIQRAYVAASLLNNRDILGIGLDNMGFTDHPDGSLIPHFVDFGGSAAYRANFGKKNFDGKAAEFSTMTEPQLQSDEYGGGPNGLVFGGIAPAVLQESLDRIVAVPEAELKTLIGQHLPDSRQAAEFFEILLQRRNAIQAQLLSGDHDRFREKRQAVIDLGVSNAYAWDAEDPDITGRIHRMLGAEIQAYCDGNLHLMADGEGQTALAEGVESLVKELMNRLLVEKNGERMTLAKHRQQMKAAQAEAEAEARTRSQQPS